MESPQVDWVVLSRDTPLTENVIRSLKDNLDWRILSQYQKLSESFIAEFRSKVDWNKICRYQKLSENFIRQCLSRGDPIDMSLISEFQSLSSIFMIENKHLLDWKKISEFQKLSDGFLIDHYDLLDMTLISKHQVLNPTVIERLSDILDWNELFKHQPLNHTLLAKHIDKITEHRKRLFDFTDNDEDDILIAPKRIKRATDNHTKPKYDLDLSSKDNNGDKSIPHYSINLGKGLLMEVKEFRSSYYVGLSKTNEDGGEIRNRFNIPLLQLETLKKACDAMIVYIAKYR
ncbi:uncharacterized protein CDAR_248061 [Caerostris darwini]|uniref:Uncharacterized protein n=1 Tax=Caerostris darwini TaxID=1538125 RepID=A0AAV4VIY7_9ARAC|nr:uncharacterized protein CDAR_248061 [Caerostris darwini]